MAEKEAALQKRKGRGHAVKAENAELLPVADLTKSKSSSPLNTKKRIRDLKGRDGGEVAAERRAKRRSKEDVNGQTSEQTDRDAKQHDNAGKAEKWIKGLAKTDRMDEKARKEKKRKAERKEPRKGDSCQMKEAPGVKASKSDTKNGTKSRREQGRDWTVSIAVAGSIMDNAQSLELATALAGQIARAAAIFCIDEVVVFEDGDDDPGRRAPRWRRGEAGDSGAVFLARLLQYCETPQYLRRHLIPMHPDLRTAGLLAPLDAPHHARAHEWISYREGVVVKPSGGGKSNGALVNVGLQKEVRISQSLEPGLRVTVAMGDSKEVLDQGAVLSAVSPSEPRERLGLYWGYSVRLAKGLSGVLAGCPYPEGYDTTLGTSEHGEKLRSTDLTLPPFKHLLIVFGGLAGLEESTELDSTIEVKDTASLFDRYLNTCAGQGSRTIRTEEALLISLTFLHEPIQRAVSEQ